MKNREDALQRSLRRGRLIDETRSWAASELADMIRHPREGVIYRRRPDDDEAAARAFPGAWPAPRR